jgi:polar amino acid transport system substrate-binding protein
MFLGLLLVAALAYLAGKNKPSIEAAHTETTYERVLRTGEIRCAYQPYAPALVKDPNTGQLSGIFYDVMTEVGRRLNVKINWVEEVGYGVIPEGFKSDRYDMFCNTVWPTPERSREGDFTIPLYYSPVDIFVRADDHRFDDDIAKLDDPSITMAMKDGDISQSFASAAFPNAKQESITQLSDTSQTLDDVANHKADATINEPSLLVQYLEHNPGSLRDIIPTRPLRVSGNTLMIKPDQYQFKVMLDTTLRDLLNSGFMDKELTKYPKSPELAVALPYRVGQ